MEARVKVDGNERKTDFFQWVKKGAEFFEGSRREFFLRESKKLDVDDSERNQIYEYTGEVDIRITSVLNDRSGREINRRIRAVKRIGIIAISSHSIRGIIERNERSIVRSIVGSLAAIFPSPLPFLSFHICRVCSY